MLTGNLSAGAPTGLWADELDEQGMSRDLVRLLGRCVAEKAESRPRDAAELAEQLKTHLSGPVDEIKVDAGPRSSGKVGFLPLPAPRGHPAIPGKSGRYLLWLGPPPRDGGEVRAFLLGRQGRCFDVFQGP